MFSKQAALFVTAVIALAANGCTTREARPVSTAAITCPGGMLRSSADAAAYAACTIVQGDLSIAGTDLTDLSSLSQLRQVTGTLTVTRNAELDELSGLENLRSVGALEVSYNPELDTLSGLDGLIEADKLVIVGNGIYNGNGLGQLRRVGSLVIEGNRKLNSLSGVRSLKQAGAVTIENNPMLCALGMLPSLHRVDSPLRLRGNRGISRREAKLVLDRAGQGDSAPRFADVPVKQVAQR